MGNKNDLLEFERGIIGGTWSRYEQSKYLANVLTPADFMVSNEYKRLYKLFLETDNINDYFTAAVNEGLQAALVNSSDTGYSAPTGVDYCIRQLTAAKKAYKIRMDLEKLMREADEYLPSLLTDYAAKINHDNTGDLENEPKRQVAEVLAGFDKPDRDSRIYTDIPLLDKMTNGLQRGNISVLGALPSAGKTAFAMTVVRSCIERGKRVAVFSLEMSVNQLWERLLANVTDIGYTNITRRTLPAEKRILAKDILEACALFGVYFFDNCLTVENMADKIVRLKPDLVVVDFLQYVRVGSQRFSSNADKLEYIIGEFKRLAKLPYSPPCHIMVLSQHNREEKHNVKGKQASMFSLKGSSGIEQGGDYIMILDRPCVVNEEEPEEKAVLSLVKNKFGRLGKVNLYFEGERQLFRELAFDENFPAPPNRNWDKEKPFK